MPASAVRAAGLVFGARYLFNGVNGESCLEPVEVDDYTSVGIFLVSLWELDPDAVALGANRGAADAVSAVRAHHGLRAPAGSAIYFACDVDPAGLPGGPPGAVPYFRGVAPAVRDAGYLVGGYLGAAAANACLDAGVVERVMLPNASAWADGATLAQPAAIRQLLPMIELGGELVDPDVADPETAGLWNGSGLWPVPQPESEVEVWTYVSCVDHALLPAPDNTILDWVVTPSGNKIPVPVDGIDQARDFCQRSLSGAYAWLLVGCPTLR